MQLSSRQAAILTRTDGWRNVLQGFGTRGRDPTMADRVAPPPVWTAEELDWLHTGDAIAARGIDLLPDDATREGHELAIDELAGGQDLDPKETAKIITGTVEYGRRISLRERIRQGFTVGRLHGGGIGVLGIDDGKMGDRKTGWEWMAEPVQEDQVQSLRWIQVIDRWHAMPGELDMDPMSPRFGQPTHYLVTDMTNGASGAALSAMSATGPIKVHGSRCVRFRGAWSPTSTGTTGNDGWDEPIPTRLRKPLAAFNLAYQGAAQAARDVARLKYEMKNLSGLLDSPRSEKLIARLQMQELVSSILNVMLLDAGVEKAEFLARPLTGFPELLDRLGIWLAACFGMPITLLLGLSPGGFGTGQDEDRRWNNVVRSYQDDHVTPVVQDITRMILLAKDGPTNGKAPSRWRIVHNALRQPTPKEQAEILSIVGNAHAKMVEWGIISAEESAEAMFGTGKLGLLVTLDREAREAAKKAAEEASKLTIEARKAELAGMTAGTDPDKAAEEEALRKTREGNGKRTPAEQVAVDAAVDVIEAVRDDRISIDSGVRVLVQMLGFRADDARALLGEGT